MQSKVVSKYKLFGSRNPSLHVDDFWTTGNQEVDPSLNDDQVAKKIKLD